MLVMIAILSLIAGLALIAAGASDRRRPLADIGARLFLAGVALSGLAFPVI